VKKWLVLLVAALACRTGRPAPVSPSGQLTGAPNARRAVEEFLVAVKAQDLQAMAVEWGTDKGPARDQLERSELEKRLIIMQTCYEHDRFQVLDESPGQLGERLVRVEIVRGTRAKRPSFTAVEGPGKRWYVKDADFVTMQDMCSDRSPRPGKTDR
jgi:hypothetical protein